MIDSILEQSGARRRHRVAPLLKEREQYLSHLLQRGTSQHRVRSIAAYLIHIIRLMELTTLRKVDLEEIKRAGKLGYLSGATPKKEGGKFGRLVLHQCGQELVSFSRPIGSSSRSSTAVP